MSRAAGGTGSARAKILGEGARRASFPAAYEHGAPRSGDERREDGRPRSSGVRRGRARFEARAFCPPGFAGGTVAGESCIWRLERGQAVLQHAASGRQVTSTAPAEISAGARRGRGRAVRSHGACVTKRQCEKGRFTRKKGDPPLTAARDPACGGVLIMTSSVPLMGDSPRKHAVGAAAKRSREYSDVPVGRHGSPTIGHNGFFGSHEDREHRAQADLLSFARVLENAGGDDPVPRAGKRRAVARPLWLGRGNLTRRGVRWLLVRPVGASLLGCRPRPAAVGGPSRCGMRCRAWGPSLSLFGRESSGRHALYPSLHRTRFDAVDPARPLYVRPGQHRRGSQGVGGGKGGLAGAWPAHGAASWPAWARGWAEARRT